MKKLTEGQKMFINVMAIFIVYGILFILFEDFDRYKFQPLKDPFDWHLLWFSIAIWGTLAFVLHRYSRRMDQRISREQAEKESQMRRELTQNISHELKTPVASIMGYTETLLENNDLPAEMQRQFIAKCHAQTQRLSHLLQDISTLNRMDYAANMLDIGTLNVADIIKEVIAESTLKLQQKGMTVRLDLPEDITIQGNASLIYSIFRNLVDNALNYAGEGTSLKISAQELIRYWKFTVGDNGVGVPQEHLSRLFERFYRVDKGRSREMGGTGLGLAIVKNAVQVHGGRITASKPKEGGLQFCFTLKK